MAGFSLRWLCAVLAGTLLAAPATLAAKAATVTGDAPGASVVWISTDSPPAPTSSEMRNVDKSFMPDLLVIPVGSVVRFPNDDPFFHSIYSETDVDSFDFGFYSTGPGKQVTFSTAGVVNVRCHIHARMHATIVVVDGPSAELLDEHFELKGVPPGAHVLHVWDAQRGERSRALDVPEGVEAVLRVPSER